MDTTFDRTYWYLKSLTKDETDYKKLLTICHNIIFKIGNKLYIFYGDGNNGKSTLINILKRILGVSVSVIPMSIPDQPEECSLINKKLYIIEELEDYRYMPKGFIKTVLSKSPMVTKDNDVIKTFISDANILMHSNNDPSMVVADPGLHSYTIPFKFTQNMSESITEIPTPEEFYDFINSQSNL